MMNNFEDMQRLGKTNMDTAVRFFGEMNRGWQAIAAEMTDYSKRSFETGTKTVEKLITAKSLEQAFEIQSEYARRCYNDYMHQVSKLGTIYADIARHAYKPAERFGQQQ